MGTFTYFSRVYYDAAGVRSAESNFPGGSLYNSSDIDDGFWNVGDSRNGGSFNYDGYFDSGGIRILVFGSATVGTFMVSASQSPGATFNEYPATYVTGDLVLNSTPVPTCFGAGTRIATPTGQVAVEDLKIGDLIQTQAGPPKAVKWVGRQAVSTVFDPAERARMVRISAGAFGTNLPLRDLFVTTDHALLLEDMLVEARALVNGTSVTRIPPEALGESYMIYHIETENHEVILAEGQPAETYIDYVARRAFDNYAEYLALYGEERAIQETAVPRISSARALPLALKARLGLTRAA